jgi:hypothetical protein
MSFFLIAIVVLVLKIIIIVVVLPPNKLLVVSQPRPSVLASVFVGLVQIGILVGSLFPIVGSVEVRQFVLGINRAEVNVHCVNRISELRRKSTAFFRS